MSEYSQEKEKKKGPPKTGWTWMGVRGIITGVGLFIITALILWPFAEEYYGVYIQRQKFMEEGEKVVERDCKVIGIEEKYSKINDYKSPIFLVTLKDTANPTIHVTRELERRPGVEGDVIKVGIEKKNYLLPSDEPWYGLRLILIPIIILSAYFFINGWIFSVMDDGGKTVWINGRSDNGTGTILKFTMFMPCLLIFLWCLYCLYFIDLIYEYWK